MEDNIRLIPSPAQIRAAEENLDTLGQDLNQLRGAMKILVNRVTNPETRKEIEAIISSAERAHQGLKVFVKDIQQGRYRTDRRVK